MVRGGGWWRLYMAVPVVLAAGCDTTKEPVNRVECDVPALFVQSCGGGACHSAEQPASGLDSSPGVGDRTVMVQGISCGGVMADPSDPIASLLYDKLQEEPGCGATMPMFDDPFTDAEKTCVRDWISGLLPPEIDTSDACPGCECEPPATESCYTGLEATEGVGQCVSGERLCGWEGTWETCEGEVLPSPENCLTDADEDCDGGTPPCSHLWSLGFGNSGS
jgi:hypothetical protein